MTTCEAGDTDNDSSDSDSSYVSSDSSHANYTNTIESLVDTVAGADEAMEVSMDNEEWSTSYEDDETDSD